MLRRSLFLFSLLVFVLAIAACGGDKPAASDAVDLASLPLNVSVDQVASLLDNPDVVVIDVREPYEYDAGHIPGSILIPLGSLPDRISEIPTDKTVIAACRSGNRSSQATQFLRQQGLNNVHNMDGGMLDWEQNGHPVEK